MNTPPETGRGGKTVRALCIMLLVPLCLAFLTGCTNSGKGASAKEIDTYASLSRLISEKNPPAIEALHVPEAVRFKDPSLAKGVDGAPILSSG